MSHDGPPVVLVVAVQHPLDDGRVGVRWVDSLLAHGFRVEWLGPDRSSSGERNAAAAYHLFEAPAGAMGRLRAMSEVFRTVRRVRPDVVLAVEPESALAAALALLTLGLTGRMVFDIHEEYHGFQLRRNIPSPFHVILRPLVVALLRALGAASAVVVGVNRTVLAPFSCRTCVVPNAPTSAFAAHVDDVRAEDGTADSFRVMHGKGTKRHGTPAVIEAARLLRSRGVDVEVCMFDYDGGGWHGASSLRAYLHREGVEDLVLLSPLVPFEEMAGLLATCHVGVIAFEPDFARIASPNRFFEYLAAGLPVLYPEAGHEMAAVVADRSCAVGIDTSDPVAIADALERLARNSEVRDGMGAESKALFRDRYEWDRAVMPVVEAIERAVSEAR